eukprot:g54335.t1
MSCDNLSDLAFNDEALLAAVTAADEAKSGSSGEVEKEQEKEEKEKEKNTPAPSSPSPVPSSPAQQELKEKKEQEEKEKKEQEEKKEKEKEKEEKEKEKKDQEEKEKKEQEEKEKEEKEKEEKEKEKKEQEEKEKKEEKDKKEKEEKEREEREQKANEKENEDDPVKLVVVARMPKGGLSYWVASGVTLASGNQKGVMHAERCWRICKPTDGVSISEHKRYTKHAWKDDFLCGQEVCLQFKKKQKKSSGWRVARFDVQLQDTGKYNTLAVWFYHEADRQKFLGLPSIISHIKCARAMDETGSARAAPRVSPRNG